jgi:SAM-dependent methyltransferase
MSAALRSRLRLLGQVVSSIRERGLLRTAHIATSELWYEARFGADTGRIIPASQLDLDAELRASASDYFPSSYLIMREAFAAAGVAQRGEVLVDYGCGLGRALLFASTLPFERLIGVELSASLCEEARANLAGYYARKTKSGPPWSVVHADAGSFEVPDDATVFYLFNPFDAQVLQRVVQQIIASLARAPRRCTLIYANALHEQVLLAHGFSRVGPEADDFAIFRRA